MRLPVCPRPCVFLCVFLRVSLCVSVRAGAANVVFRPNVRINWMQFGLGGKLTVGAAAAGGPFELIHLTVY